MDTPDRQDSIIIFFTNSMRTNSIIIFFTRLRPCKNLEDRFRLRPEENSLCEFGLLWFQRTPVRSLQFVSGLREPTVHLLLSNLTDRSPLVRTGMFGWFDYLTVDTPGGRGSRWQRLPSFHTRTKPINKLPYSCLSWLIGTKDTTSLDPEEKWEELETSTGSKSPTGPEVGNGHL